MRRFACDSIPAVGQVVALSADVSHHVLRVTRLRRGGRLSLFDAHGQTGIARLVASEDGRALVEVESVEAAVAPPPPLHACLAVTKGSRFELAVRMAVELGATTFWPVLAKRSVARGDRHARWQRVIDGAVGQSGHRAVPVLHPLQSVRELLVQPGLAAVETRWVAVPGAASVPGSAGAAAVLVGPEGGWTSDEVAAATAAGWHSVGLGAGVLRAETAVAAALTRIRCAGPAR